MPKDAMKKPQSLTPGLFIGYGFPNLLLRAVKVLKELTLGRQNQPCIAIGH